jgi:hypothetical protein
MNNEERAFVLFMNVCIVGVLHLVLTYILLFSKKLKMERSEPIHPSRTRLLNWHERTLHTSFGEKIVPIWMDKGYSVLYANIAYCWIQLYLNG